MMKTLPVGSVVIALALQLALAPGATAQTSGVIEQPSVLPSTIVIVNAASIRLGFSIRPEDGVWSQIHMNPGENITYSCRECTTPSFEFILRTGNKKVHYNLTTAKRYSISWSNRKDSWDIYEVD